MKPRVEGWVKATLGAKEEMRADELLEKLLWWIGKAIFPGHA
jgi:hypothetical protein